ncbi:glycoside hydrolase family 16 protein [Pimelobacter simplex]|uniref:glycoside hydrolase family 16 protein n=1 Tax=Nocardioides simplex TaxID=2045 RepID=UPI001931B0D7|nr:glycoside hydrolase family 16 protein [Pimelobacter simplex]
MGKRVHARRIAAVAALAALAAGLQPAPAAPAARAQGGTPHPVRQVADPVDACGTRPLRADGSYYACTFHDEFDGTTLDRTRWMAQDTKLTGVFTGQGGCYLDNSRTIAVGGGSLRLTATIRDQLFVCQSPYAPFPTNSEVSTVATISRFTQTHGRFSARVRFSPSTGGHAAFWLYPQVQTYGRWPLSGEVDIAEWFGNDPSHVYPSLHYFGEERARSTGRTCPGPTASTGFHTYTVEWTPTIMRFSYDDQLCWSHAWTPTNVRPPAPFDKPFYIVLTQIWGTGSAARTATSPRTATMVVDWVRAWR